MQKLGVYDVYGTTAEWKLLGPGERRLFGAYVRALRGLGPAGTAASTVAAAAAAETGRLEAAGDPGRLRPERRRQSSSLVRKRQERAVELWARRAGCWFGDDADEFLTTTFPFEGYGSRSDVFLDRERNRVIKLTKINYADLGTGLDMMALFNLAADEMNRYSLIGFGRRESEEMSLYGDLGMAPPPGLKGDFCAILSQPYMAEEDIDFKETARLTAGDILRHLNERLAPYCIVLAPEHAGSYAFANGLIVVSDAIPGNVVVAKRNRKEHAGGLVVLDADFELKTDVFVRFHAHEHGSLSLPPMPRKAALPATAAL